MKSWIFVISLSLVGQLAFTSPFHPCHVPDFYGKAVEQIKLGLKIPSQPRPSTQTGIEEPVTQIDAPWGLARISHADLLNRGTVGKYVYDPSGGLNVNVYILATGIHLEHSDFGNRAIWGTTVATDSKSDDDNKGYGTHYAGTVAGKEFGVSKQATLIAVKTSESVLLNVAAMIEGVKWTIKDHQKRAADDGKLKGSVIMLNTGMAPFSARLIAALDTAYDAGIHVAVAAGDNDRDACQSAAGSTKGLVVGSSDARDDRSSWSDSGSCVDIFAPGDDILSALPGKPDNSGILGGTGSAAAHVAGLMAYFISAADKGDSSPDVIKKKILDMAVKDMIHDVPDDAANVSRPLISNVI